MTFKLKTFAAVGALIGSLALVGCGQDEKDPNHIKVGVIVGAEQQVAETAVKVAKEKYGLDVELVTFNDYVLPNEALSKGDIDANAFQHKPYLDQQIKDRGYKLAAAFGHLGNANHPDVQRAIQHIFARAKAHGKPCGILAPVEADARRYLEWGATFVAVGSDLGVFRSATQKLADSFKK
jgi:ABC-type phosphate/phosphonate transport system substrate-binding protein